VNHRADDICTRFTETGTIDGYKKINVIGIQDLGSEPAESCYMGNRLNVLRNLIEARGDRSDTITFITSNIPINHKMLVEQYNDRVASRLCEMCNYYEIRGVDRRKM
jgi:DNA replication protein DnaC